MKRHVLVPASLVFILGACVGTDPGSAATAPPSPPAPDSAAPSALPTRVVSASPSIPPTSSPGPPTPAATTGPCPTANPLRVANLVAADLACFGAGDISVVGWEDEPPVFGILPPGIAPQWLWSGLSGSVLWDRPRGALTDLECSQGQCPPYLFMHIAPESNVTFASNGRWVVVTGHRSDPLAETCHWVYPPTWEESPYPDEDARQLCRESFVLVSVELASPPGE